MVNSQELIIKKIEELCARLVQNYEEWFDGKETRELKERIKREGDVPEKESEYKVESEKNKEKFLKRRSEIYREIKDQILKDLTL